MIKGEDITRESLIEHLTKGFCKVQFRKQTDGKFRSLVCTLDSKQIPAKFAKGVVSSIEGKDDPTKLSVFDLVSRDWRSFYIPNIMYYYTEDHLRGQKEEKTENNEEKGVKNAKRTPDRRKAQAPQAKRPNKKK